MWDIMDNVDPAAWKGKTLTGDLPPRALNGRCGWREIRQWSPSAGQTGTGSPGEEPCVCVLTCVYLSVINLVRWIGQ